MILFNLPRQINCYLALANKSFTRLGEMIIKSPRRFKVQLSKDNVIYALESLEVMLPGPEINCVVSAN